MDLIPGPEINIMHATPQKKKKNLAFLLAMCPVWFGRWHSGDARTSQVVLMVRDPPANAGDIRDVGLIPGSG